MDLGAYSQISKIEEIAKRNGISVPRLRGYRLMKNEKPLTREEINSLISDINFSIVEGLCRTEPLFDVNAHYHSYCLKTDKVVEKYIEYEYNHFGTQSPIRICWELIHGKKRKNLKFELKKNKRAVLKQYEMFNKYCGREDVLYIHSRIGGGNWAYYKGDEAVKSQSWYLDHVDDSFDSTYCDIYAKIDINTLNEVMKDGSE